jgi:hypothetical protein
MKSKSDATVAGDWRVCEGEVGHLVHRLRWRRRSSRIRRGALLATLAIVTLCGNYFYSDVATELAIKASGKPCDHYAQELRAFYCDKSLGELDTQFWEHLSRCPDCQRDFRFFGSISRHAVAHALPHDKGAHSPGSGHSISLDQLLQQATFAAHR